MRASLSFYLSALRQQWRALYKTDASPRAVTYPIQELALGGLRRQRQRQLRQIGQESKETGEIRRRARPTLKPGTLPLREWQGRTYEVLVLDDGFSWHGTRYRSLFALARKITGTGWSGSRFFGLKQTSPTALMFRQGSGQPKRTAMPRADATRRGCAIYTCKSSEEGHHAVQDRFSCRKFAT